MRGENTAHKCYLLYPEEGIVFQMDVELHPNHIDVSPVTVEGIDDEDLNDEARDLVQEWAKEEAMRVGLHEAE